MAVLAALGLLGASRLGAQSTQDQTAVPTFRASVDVVAVDVQVVDKTGLPIPYLKAADFDVSIAGKRRRVVSVDYIQSASLEDDPVGTAGHPMSAVARAVAPEPGAGRTFVLAFDTDSFTVAESRDVVAAARQFIHNLQPADSSASTRFPSGRESSPPSNTRRSVWPSTTSWAAASR